MAIDYQVFSSKEQLLEEGPRMLARWCAFWNWERKMQVSYQMWEAPRTRSQLNLYWQWMSQLATGFSRAGSVYSKDDMHDLMRHKFLGYEEKVIGHTKIKDQLKSVADGKIGKARMSEYMHQIDSWAADHGILLPSPELNEYTKYKEARN